ncbi:PTS transporter subunit EIIB, partial [Burkholderia cenocepacia]|uniref:PTS transporter subunit EIIB n=1 Tax=Burkholderia cenocepacia TaxID=95486 RepID=UPI0024B77F6C
IAALGGAANLSVVDACTTRLRLTVVDPEQVSEPELKSIGARGAAAVAAAPAAGATNPPDAYDSVAASVDAGSRPG